jgi:hypothetical protein
LDEDAPDRGHDDHRTAADAEAMRPRKVGIEPRCADANAWHGSHRFRLRGYEQLNIHAQLIAAGQHLKRLLSQRGRGRRLWPNGAAGVGLPATQPIIAPSR